MNIQKMKEEKGFYIELVRVLKSFRRPAHIASAITSILFVVVFIIGQDWAAPAIQFLGFWSYIIVGLLAVLLVFPLELRIEKLINIFAHLITTGHSWRLAAGVAVVLLPFVFMTTITSFVGSSESAAIGADSYHEEKLKELSATLSENKHVEHHTTREQTLIEQKQEQRKVIELKFQKKLADVPTTNSLKFSKFKTDDWHKKQFHLKNRTDSSYIEKKMIQALEAFDAATDKELKALQKEHNNIQSAKASAQEAIVKAGTKIAAGKVDRFKWFGFFFGGLSVIGVIISIIAALITNWACYHLNITDADLKTKKK